ncbi:MULTISPECIES: Fur family transcriptional regulator [Terrabacteria group]|uniref:Fur family transcriptional regulator n=1 Tax=Bacillati TaxID=1783272 RepID=UPI00193A8019|nr:MULTISPECIES: transcriptional repressor [Terrabacteria group]MBW9212530.1 transcriptional repressor [Trueperella sp. zg.1013]QRG86718.1 transcriptional repressor [Bulleidia sp. zg-1006]
MKRRQTEQKKAILEAIHGEGKHLSAEQVKSLLSEQGLDIGLATVYRNLNQLAEDGVIRKMVGENFNLFDGNPNPHDHFVCLKCGKLIDLGNLPYDSCPDRQLEMACPELKLISHTTLFEGYCHDCQEEDKKNGIKGIEDRKKFE